jgi:hypothetical protein
MAIEPAKPIPQMMFWYPDPKNRNATTTTVATHGATSRRRTTIRRRTATARCKEIATTWYGR